MSLDRFIEVYAVELARCHAENPADYAYPTEKVPAVVNRIRYGLMHGSFIPTSKAFRRTCRVLGIKPTKKAILEFVNG